VLPLIDVRVMDNMSEIDWSRLRKLRQGFLEADGHLPDYWRDLALLAAYDQTFAQRIGWKWQAVLEGAGVWQAPLVIDWGCGSGIAARTAFRSACVSADRVLLYDRSDHALRFAARMLAAEQPGLAVETTRRLSEPATPFGLLVSHVLSELPDPVLEELVSLAERAQWVMWVEAGRAQESRKLGQIRDRLAAEKTIVAPCPHQAPCGMLRLQQQQDWCHFFADPPRDVFQSSFWRQASRELGIDLRSLPVSYLIAGPKESVPTESSDCIQVLGRARLYKGHCRWTGCEAAGIVERDHQKRDSRELYARLGEPGLHTRLKASELAPHDKTREGHR
jgi:hypothetical protein